MGYHFEYAFLRISFNDESGWFFTPATPVQLSVTSSFL